MSRCGFRRVFCYNVVGYFAAVHPPPFYRGGKQTASAGTNGEREMAYSMYLAGFDVKDVMMTDLISGRETLEDVNFIVFCGGFSNSDVQVRRHG